MSTRSLSLSLSPSTHVRRKAEASARAKVTCAALLLAASVASAYPLDGADDTGITRLQGYSLAQAGKVDGPALPPGALASSDAVRLHLADRNDFTLPAPDPEWNAKLRQLLGDEADRYAVAILDLSDPGRPRYASHRDTAVYHPGSVGKLLVALAVFQAVADVYPDDLEARRRVLRETRVVADSVIQSDSHTVPFWGPGDPKVDKRRLREGDVANLWTYLDWMCSNSSNAAASAVMQELLLLTHSRKRYPVPADEARAFLIGTPKPDLQRLFLDAMTGPVTRNGLDLDELRQGSFFTRAGKRLVPGTTSHATPRGLMKYLVRMEQGRLVDAFSSLEIKKLLYLTDRRIRYASAPALGAAAVYFKSGSWYGCKPEEGFRCRPYAGNVRNFMNSVVIVETPQRQPQLHYLVVVMSNVLRKNSAVAHQTLGTRIHRWMEAVHPTSQTSRTGQTGPTD